MTPEKRVQNEILSYLKNLSKTEPLFYERRQAGGFSYKMGIPDIYFVYNGIHVEVEVKAPNGHLSPMQEKFREMCEKKNIIWVCADSLEDVKKVVEVLKPRP